MKETPRQRKNKIIDEIISLVVKNHDEFKNLGTYFLNLNYKGIKNIQYAYGSYDMNLGRSFWFYQIAEDGKKRNITTGWKESELRSLVETIREVVL